MKLRINKITIARLNREQLKVINGGDDHDLKTNKKTKKLCGTH